VHRQIQGLIRDVVLILLGLLSLKITAWSIREGNEFTWFPIKEVGITVCRNFMTIVPALLCCGPAAPDSWDLLWRQLKRTLALFLDHRSTLQLFGQCPNLFNFF